MENKGKYYSHSQVAKQMHVCRIGSAAKNRGVDCQENRFLIPTCNVIGSFMSNQLKFASRLRNRRVKKSDKIYSDSLISPDLVCENTPNGNLVIFGGGGTEKDQNKVKTALILKKMGCLVCDATLVFFSSRLFHFMKL